MNVIFWCNSDCTKFKLCRTQGPQSFIKIAWSEWQWTSMNPWFLCQKDTVILITSTINQQVPWQRHRWCGDLNPMGSACSFVRILSAKSSNAYSKNLGPLVGPHVMGLAFKNFLFYQIITVSLSFCCDIDWMVEWLMDWDVLASIKWSHNYYSVLFSICHICKDAPYFVVCDVLSL